MPSTESLQTLARALRAARKARKVSIAMLAAEGGVSPRLISEFEQGKRPHVSLDTILRLLALMHVPVTVAGTPLGDITLARADRAERRRQTWSGFQSTVAAQDDPAPPTSAVARLAAVGRASRLAVALQRASRSATKGAKRKATPTSARAATNARGSR
jgi:transcriptional regulator with XRE-family HTH domain